MRYQFDEKKKCCCIHIRGVAKKNNGTGRPADMVEDPQTTETRDIIAIATAIDLLSRAPFVHDV